MNGEEIMELARVIKCDEEIKAMRRAIVACDRSMDVMKDNLHPGVTEQRLWSYLHAENIARGGEWIETRVLAAGPRANPWFQECSSRKIQNGELTAFDTDLIGSYGMCVDISRTWLCGDAQPTPEQKEIYTMAYEQIQKNTEILRSGITFKELSHTAVYYPRDEFRHYSTFYHGVGLCDEYPGITFPWYWNELSPDGVLEPGMVICVESFIGRYAGGPGVKLEDQVLITEDGYELLSHYPYEENLLL
jgi:Xaa-Pro aminopeptidase